MSIDDTIREIHSFNIPNNWKNLILARWKEDARRVRNIDEITYVLTYWSWLKNKPSPVLETIELLCTEPVASITMLIDLGIIKKGLNYQLSGKDEERLRKMYTRALRSLERCELITTYTLTNEELGPGKRAVKLFVSPFANENHLKRTKDWYLSTGGTLLRSKIKERNYRDAARRQADYIEAQNREHFLRRVVKLEKVGIRFFECNECNTTIKILRNELDQYNIKGDVLYKKCRCGNDFFVRVNPQKMKSI